MTHADFSESIRNLPEADIPVEGVRAWLSQGPNHQIAFFEIEPIGSIPPHHHGEQWGIVVEGEMMLTISGDTRRYGPGDSYHIPAGAVHSAELLTRVRAIDFFADVDRYAVRA